MLTEYLRFPGAVVMMREEVVALGYHGRCPAVKISSIDYPLSVLTTKIVVCSLVLFKYSSNLNL